MNQAPIEITTIESHTEGMATRVVTGGIGPLPGWSMAERRLYVMNERDDLRRLLMHEPRGHSAMSGTILQPPIRSDADVGIVFIEASGCLPMCGHGTIGTATVLVETGRVAVSEPITTIRFDTPAGLVEAQVLVEDGHAKSVTIRNVPSYLHLRSALAKVSEVGEVELDLAWGGNFYAIVSSDSLGVDLVPSQYESILRAGLATMDAVNEQCEFAHPLQPDINECKHVMITSPLSNGSSHGVVVIHPGWIDRSPCGTGTSARMAQLHARGQLDLEEDFFNMSIIGTRFLGRLVGETTVGEFNAVLPTVTGRAWITGSATYVVSEGDPFPAGFQINQA